MASDKVLALGKDNWEAEVVKSGVPVLVDFWAPWCQPCRRLTPVIEQLAASFDGKAKVGKVNADEQPDLASEYGISGLPTLLFFKGGKEPAQRLTGVKSYDELARELTTLVG